MAERTIAFGYPDVGACTLVIKRASDGKFWDGDSWESTKTSLSLTRDDDIDQYYTETSPNTRCFWTAYDPSGVPITSGEYSGGFLYPERPITFGYPDAGAVTIVIKRASDGKYWAGSAWATTAPSPALSMTRDADIDQYYTNTLPTARCMWTAYDSGGTALASGEYSGGFPEVSTPASASMYTIQEVIDRIRRRIHDTNAYNYTNSELLSLLTDCVEWIMQKCAAAKANLGTKRASYVGDGTTEWALPMDFLTHRAFVLARTDGTDRELSPTDRMEYDRGGLALAVSGPWYYIIDGFKLYFIDDLTASDTVYLYYYHRIDALELTDAVPFDGVFLDLMVMWGAAKALQFDEYDISLELAELERRKDEAIAFLHRRSSYPQTIRSPKRSYIDAKHS